MPRISSVVGRALRGVHSTESELAIHRLGADRLPCIRVASDSFENGAPIPPRHQDRSPPLRFSGVPGGTKELALIVEDPDAPTPMPFVHWLLYGLPADTAELRGGIEEHTPLLGGKQGETTMRHTYYDGPSPPRGHGVHHYHFQVFALDTHLDLPPGAGRRELLEAMEGHVIAAGDLVGTFERD